MSINIVRQLTPEEEELGRKRDELAAVRAALAGRELELTDFRSELKAFEGRYLREVGALYAELDLWDARVAELEASLENSSAASQRATRARKRADESHEASHGEASKAQYFKPTADLKSLFREAAKRVHPDFAKDEADRQRRTCIMAEMNDAYSRGDSEAIRQMLNNFSEADQSLLAESVGSQLIRIIRQIAEAKKRIAKIEHEIASLNASELAKLREDIEKATEQGRDLMAELAANVSAQILRARKEFEVLERGVPRDGRRG